jgi:hypothetical protein
MSRLESDKGDKLNLSTIFLYSALLIPLCLIGCGDKSSPPNESKSLKIEITAPNESRDEPKSKGTSKGLNAIGGIKAGDPINRIDIVFGIDTLSEKWHEFTPGIYHLLTTREFDGELYEIHIIKNKENKIKAIACGLMTPGRRLYEMGGAAGEAFFAMNRSKCDGEIVKLFSPVFSSQLFSHDKNVTQNFGEPLTVKQLKPKPFYIGFPDEEKMRRLEYQNTFLYTHLDRVHGMAIFDDDIKKIWIEKIESGLIK